MILVPIFYVSIPLQFLDISFQFQHGLMLSMSIYKFVSKEFDIDIENIRVPLRVLRCNFKSAPL